MGNIFILVAVENHRDREVKIHDEYFTDRAEAEVMRKDLEQKDWNCGRQLFFWRVEEVSSAER